MVPIKWLNLRSDPEVAGAGWQTESEDESMEHLNRIGSSAVWEGALSVKHLRMLKFESLTKTGPRDVSSNMLGGLNPKNLVILCDLCVFL